jgi:hypothetical protein
MKKSVDLGSLQDNYEKARKTFKAAQTSYEKAEVTRDSAKAAFQKAEQELKDATRAVLQ